MDNHNVSFKLCRICLKDESEAQICNTSAFHNFFKDIVRLSDVPETVSLCAWCRTKVRSAVTLHENILRTAPILRWLEKAQHTGAQIDFRVIAAVKSLQKPMHCCSIHNNEVLFINDEDLRDTEKFTNVKLEYSAEYDSDKLTLETVEDNTHIDVKKSHSSATLFFHDDEVANSKDSENNIKRRNDVDAHAHDVKIEILSNTDNMEDLSHDDNIAYEVDKENTFDNSTEHYDKKEVTVLTQVEDKLRQKNKEFQFEVVYLSTEEQFNHIKEKCKEDKYVNAKYRCKMCGIGFLTADVHSNHLDRHRQDFGEHVCAICTLRFSSPQVLSQHMLSHRRRFRCLVCGATVSRRSGCLAHRERCGGLEEPVACEFCQKVYRNTDALKQHVKGVHLSGKSFVCDYCKRSFRLKQKLRVHLRIHTGQKPFQCEKCKRRFGTNSNLKSHIATHFPNEKNHYCVECNAYFRTAKSLKRHFVESVKHCDKDSLRYSCADCPQRFQSDRRLKSHVDFVHLKVCPYRCAQCEKGFVSNGNLKKHIRNVHEKKILPKDKMCHVCGRGFAQRRTLDCHLRTHSGEKPFSCDHCSARFAQASAKYTHIRMVHLKLDRRK